MGSNQLLDCYMLNMAAYRSGNAPPNGATAAMLAAQQNAQAHQANVAEINAAAARAMMQQVKPDLAQLCALASAATVAEPFDPYTTCFTSPPEALEELARIDPKLELSVEDALRFLWDRRDRPRTYRSGT